MRQIRRARENAQGLIKFDAHLVEYTSNALLVIDVVSWVGIPAYSAWLTAPEWVRIWSRPSVCAARNAFPLYVSRQTYSLRQVTQRE